jgi:hypothetical protein
MELLPVKQIASPVAQRKSRDSFLRANTISIEPDRLKADCIIPSFAKDNESTISHSQFVEAVYETASQFFTGETILDPAVRVSHTIKGRIPEAMGKPAKMLTDAEKTIYYERMAFIIELPGIHDSINGNDLNLVIGGVRAYNHENLYAKKTAERFKIFVGFQVQVCCNLCVWTDGIKADLRVRTLHELANEVFKMLTEYQAMDQIRWMKSLTQQSLSESQFAKLIGRLRMYPFLPSSISKSIPELMLTDSQISSVVRGFYQDENFQKGASSEIGLWQLFNLFTEASKGSYIDRYLARNVSASSFIWGLQNALKQPSEGWYLA